MFVYIVITVILLFGVLILIESRRIFTILKELSMRDPDLKKILNHVSGVPDATDGQDDVGVAYIVFIGIGLLAIGGISLFLKTSN